jgi:hemerythrin
MKRDEALAPLSRDHHGTLLLAQLLKKNAPVYRGLPTEPEAKAKYAQEQFENHIKKHFLQEEMMLEKAKDCHPELNALTEEIKNDHQQLTALFKLLDDTADLKNTMNILANLLQLHIRKEERVLFPLLQKHASPELLQEIHKLLH